MDRYRGRHGTWDNVVMTLKEYLAEAGLVDDEGNRLELKDARGGVPKSAWESVSAFANSTGGRVLFGVDNSGNVQGLDDPDQIQADIASALHQVLTPSIQADPFVVEIEGKRIVALDVPEAEPYLKPVYITSRGVATGAFKRVGSSDLRLSSEDLTRLAAERSGVSPDQQVPPHSTLDGIDETLIQRYRNRLRAARPDSPLLGFGDEELLRGLNLLQSDAGIERPNRAAILLFGKEATIRRFFPGVAFQILEVSGTNWVPQPDARPKTLEMPVTGLVELASRLANDLIGRIPEGVRFSEGSLYRSADPVHVAVREGVINALIHQDHLAFQPTQFRRFSDRLEIENPGVSKKPLSHFDRPGSAPRNPLLAHAFNIVGLAERVGSGILTMKSGFRNAGLAEPSFESDERSQQFRVVFYWHNLASEREIDHVGALDELNEDQKRVLLFTLRKGRVENENVRDLTGRNIVRASEVLRRLVKLGFLDKHGGGSATYYTPNRSAHVAGSGLRGGRSHVGHFDLSEGEETDR